MLDKYDVVFLMGFFLGMIVGWVILWAYFFPRVAQFLLRLFVVLVRAFAIVTMSIGLGGIAWSVLVMTTNGKFNSVEIVPGTFEAREPSEALGYAVGFLVAGVVALVLSFLGRKKHPAAVEVEKTELPEAPLSKEKPS